MSCLALPPCQHPLAGFFNLKGTMSPLENMILAALALGAPEQVWRVGADADIQFGVCPENPFAGLLVTNWPAE